MGGQLITGVGTQAHIAISETDYGQRVVKVTQTLSILWTPAQLRNNCESAPVKDVYFKAAKCRTKGGQMIRGPGQDLFDLTVIKNLI